MDVGSIVATLSLKKDQWDASIKAVKQDNQSLSGLVLNNEQTFKKMGTAMTIAGGMVVGSVGLMVKSYVDAGSAVWDLSKKTGMSTTALSELKYMAEQNGASLGDVEVAAKKMASAITDAGNGNKTAIATFADLGLSIDDLKNMKPEDQFYAIAEAISEVEDPILRASLAQDAFGKSGTNLLPIFSDGKKGVIALREETHKLGIVFDTEAAAAADKLGDAQTKLKGAVSGLGISLAQTLAPALTKIVDGMSNAIAKVQEWMKEHPALVGWILKLVTGVGGLMLALGPVMIALPTLVKSFLLLKPAMAPIGTGVAVIAAAFVGWNIGKKIGEIELFGKSINTYMTENFSKLINIMGLYKGSAEKATNVTDLLATASKIAGKEITNKGKAMQIVRAEYEKSGTVGNKMLDDWAEKSKNAEFQTAALSQTVIEQTKAVGAHGKSVSQLARELEEAKKKLEELKSELGMTFTSDHQEKINKIKDALVKYKGQLDPESEIKLREELGELQAAATLAASKFNIFSGSLKTFNAGLIIGTDSLNDFDKAYLKLLTRGGENRYFEEAASQIDSFKVAIEQTGPVVSTLGKTVEDLAKKTKTAATGIMQEVSTVVSDAMRNIGAAIASLFNFKGLFGVSPKALKFDDSYYKQMTKAADDAYENEKSLIEENKRVLEKALSKEIDDIRAKYDEMENVATKAFKAEEKAADSAFDAIEDAARKAFDAANDSARSYFNAQEKLLSRAEQDEDIRISRREDAEDRKYERQYERARNSIINSNLTENQKEQALNDLEKNFEAAKLAREIAREDAKLVRERAREDAQDARQLAFDAAKETREIAYDVAKEAREVANDLAAEGRQEAFQLKLEGIRTAQATAEQLARDNAQTKTDELLANLVASQNAHQLELDAIRVAEDIARQKQADDEETRQGTLWFKVKGIFATACENMATIFLTKMLTDPGSLASMVKKVAGLFTGKGSDELGGALEDAGGGITTLGGKISDFITGIGSGIGGFISGLAKGIGLAITTLSTAIGGAIVVIAESVAAAAVALAAAVPELLAVGLAAAAIYTAFQLGSALVSGIASIFGGGGQTDVTYWLKFMKDDIKEIHDHFLDVKSLMFNDYWDCFQTIRDKSVDMYDKLKDIAKNTKDTVMALGNLPKAQHGMVSTTTQMAILHGTVSEPEYVIPSRNIKQLLTPSFNSPMIPAVAGGGGSNMSINFYAPLIQADGRALSDRDIHDAGEKLYKEVQYQAKRLGK